MAAEVGESGGDEEAIFFAGGSDIEATLFVGLELEACGGREDATDGAEFFGHKRGDLEEILGLDDDGEVVAAAHEKAVADLVEARDAAGHAIEATAGFGGDSDFDEGADATLTGLLAVDDGLVAENGAVGFSVGGALRNFGLGDAKAKGEFGRGELGIVMEEVDEGVHGGSRIG